MHPVISAIDHILASALCLLSARFGLFTHAVAEESVTGQEWMIRTGITERSTRE